ncbi:MAG: 3'(2'),5'-bisphosphate nucleotidase CysQ [Xanthobacteraceae bacterium]|nr:3'(2'),5'-bisphosphate nucleotidase CysQ [Xanthobacteraceae bacterium]
MRDVDASDSAAGLSRERDLLAATTQAAGELAFRMFRTSLKTWTKGMSSPVSEADIAVNALIEQRLRAVTPDYGWLSEESADDAARLARRRVWIVDPIDGTRSYLAGRDDWCVSLALVEDARPLLAAVFAPARDEFYLAARGGGATLNGRPIQAAPGTAIDYARVAGPKPLVERLGRLPWGTALHPRIGSLALRLCRIGDGALDVAFAGGNSHDWDIAAADLIVHEAGGNMTALSGDPVGYNHRDAKHDALVAAGNERHRAIIARLGTK